MKIEWRFILCNWTMFYASHKKQRWFQGFTLYLRLESCLMTLSKWFGKKTFSEKIFCRKCIKVFNIDFTIDAFDVEKLSLIHILLTCNISAKRSPQKVHQTVDCVLWFDLTRLRVVFLLMRLVMVFFMSCGLCFFRVQLISPCIGLYESWCINCFLMEVRNFLYGPDLCDLIKRLHEILNGTKSELKYQTWLTWQMKCISFCSFWSLTSLTSSMDFIQNSFFILMNNKMLIGIWVNNAR